MVPGYDNIGTNKWELCQAKFQAHLKHGADTGGSWLKHGASLIRGLQAFLL